MFASSEARASVVRVCAISVGSMMRNGSSAAPVPTANARLVTPSPFRNATSSS